jgi:hypothetical protein
MADVLCHPPQIRDHDEQSADRTDMKKPRGGSWYTPGLLTRYAILGNTAMAVANITKRAEHHACVRDEELGHVGNQLSQRISSASHGFYMLINVGGFHWLAATALRFALKIEDHRFVGITVDAPQAVYPFVASN